MIKPNSFFDPADSPFEVLGFFEEYIAEAVGGNWNKVLGWKVLDVDSAPRPLGSDGRKVVTLTEPIVLKHGMKFVTVKASPQRPVHVITMVQALCGKKK